MKINKLIIAVLILAGLLRFYGLMHDSPYFFNPDERNMAIAISQFRLPNKLIQIPNCLISEFNPKNISTTGNREPETGNCNLNPRFFAYGQFPLYLAYASDQITKPIINLFNIKHLTFNFSNQTGDQKLTTDFPSAIFWLRFYSALFSTLTIILVYLITNIVIRKKLNFGYWSLEFGHLAALSAAFSPGLIQSAHFGTTESLLTFFFLASTYLSLNLIWTKDIKKIKQYLIPASKFLLLTSVVIGLALGTKLTGLFFLVPPGLAILINIVHILILKKKNKPKWIAVFILTGFFIILSGLLFSVIASPYNLIDFQGFKGSVFGYEKDVAMGKFDAFYTTQFKNTIPVIFQTEKVFPYVLGWPVFIAGSIGFVIIIINITRRAFLALKAGIKYLELRIKKKRATFRNLIFATSNFQLQTSNFLILTSSFLIYFLPNAFLYAKWTRFMTPIIPFFYVFSAYFITQLTGFFNNHYSQNQKSNLVFTFAFCVLSLLPGAAFMSIYTHEDSRISASRVIYDLIPNGSYILSETANVVDIPLGLSNFQLPTSNFQYTVISFDFYHMNENPQLMTDLITHLQKAEYIFIPSRRIFANYPKFPEIYPQTAKYYQNLFSGALGFEKIAEISSFPKLEAGSWMLEFNDEQSEETYTVFDHPVIRIYKKVVAKTEEEYQKMLIN